MMKHFTRAMIAFAALAAFAAEPEQLFNGRDLTGWRMTGPGRFDIENGLLKTVGGMGLLYYEGRKFGDTTIRAVFKTTGQRDNSGIYIRMPDPPSDPWYGVHNGFEVQIDGAGDDWHSTGAIYSLSKVSKRMQKAAGEWNTMEIRLHGPVTTISLNGEIVNTFDPAAPVPERKQWFEPVRGPRPDSGYIGIQNHDDRSTVYFKEISVIASEPAPGLTSTDRSKLMSYLHATRKQYLDIVNSASPAQWNFKPAPEKWSIGEVAEHLAMSEGFLANFALSGLKNSAPDPGAKKITDEAITKMIADRSQKASAPEPLKPSGKLSREQIVTRFEQARARNIQWAQRTGDPARARFVTGPMGTLDVYQMFLMLGAHTERHLAQMREVQSSPGYPAK